MSLVALLSLSLSTLAFARAPVATDIGHRLELFIDNSLIEKSTGTHLQLQKPVKREVVLVHDAPWEGNACGYHVVIRDGKKYQMWYRGTHWDMARKRLRLDFELACYVESRDGIRWTRPKLGLVEFQGSRANNIFWTERMTRHAKGQKPAKMPLIPFIDLNPRTSRSERYKAVAGAMEAGLYGWTSPDGIHWKQIGHETIFRDPVYIDWTQSAFWDPNRKSYVAYLRDWWPGGIGGDGTGNVRAYRHITSDDFLQWSKPKRLRLSRELSRSEQLYTNQIRPYYRAPHIYLGFPNRYSHGRSDDSTNDGMFMTSRNGVDFHLWRESIIRPGLQVDRWMTRNNMIALGILETEATEPGLPPELSIYSTEGYLGGADGTAPSCRLRRHTYRMDGFVSMSAPPTGGEFTTRPFVFDGKHLVLNFSTSAPGHVRVEIQDASGKPIPGFTLKDSANVYGDSIEYAMRWKGQGGYTTDVSRLSGKPVRLRVVMKEADLFSFQFRDSDKPTWKHTGFAIPGTSVIRK